MEASATFKTDGEALTGTMESQAGSTAVKGTVKGNAHQLRAERHTPRRATSRFR